MWTSNKVALEKLHDRYYNLLQRVVQLERAVPVTYTVKKLNSCRSVDGDYRLPGIYIIKEHLGVEKRSPIRYPSEECAKAAIDAGLIDW